MPTNNKNSELGVIHRLVDFLHLQTNLPTSQFTDDMTLGGDSIGYTGQTIVGFYKQMNALFHDVGVVTRRNDFNVANSLSDVQSTIWAEVPPANQIN